MYSNTSSIVHVAHSTHPGHGASARAAGGTFASRTAADFEAWPEPSSAVESNIRKASLRVTTGGRHHLRAFALSRSWLGPIDDEVLARAARPGRTCRVEQQLSSVEKIGRSRLLVQLREHAHGQCQREMVSHAWLVGWCIKATVRWHVRLAWRCYGSLPGSRCGPQKSVLGAAARHQVGA